MLSRMSANSRIPAVVVSGFLGSGKTTLVRHLLADAQRSGRRAAVVSNEFGALGIDGALLSRDGDDYVELSGGCVCCRLSDELVETLQMLRERADPDLVIIETSGVALPFDVQLNFWREPISEWIETDMESAEAKSLMIKTLDPNGKMRRDQSKNVGQMYKFYLISTALMVLIELVYSMFMGDTLTKDDYVLVAIGNATDKMTGLFGPITALYGAIVTASFGVSYANVKQGK